MVKITLFLCLLMNNTIYELDLYKTITKFIKLFNKYYIIIILPYNFNVYLKGHGSSCF